jgi:5'-AMP-activated protein kinase, catalytic alpha subunit
LAAPIFDSEGNQKLLSGYCGTKNYIAPEIFECYEDKLKYSGDKADLFACGVILYNMVSGKMPFQKAEFSDPTYRHVYKGDL